MNKTNEDEKPDRADPLEGVILRLRDEVVPPVPTELLAEPTRRANSSIRNMAIAVLAVAAAIVFAIVLPRTKPNPISPGAPVVQNEPSISVVPVAQLDPYENLETELSEMKQEIAELRRRAELLDVYRRTNSLLVKN